MAAYPTGLNAYIGTTLDFEDGLVVDRSTAGALRGRSFFTTHKAVIQLLHGILLRSQVYGGTTTIMGFYAAWRAGTSPFTSALEPFTVTLDGVGYNAVFVKAPKIEMIGYNNYRVTSFIAEV